MELPSYKRGCHVITRKVVDALPELSEFDVGLVNFFSASTPLPELSEFDLDLVKYFSVLLAKVE